MIRCAYIVYYDQEAHNIVRLPYLSRKKEIDFIESPNSLADILYNLFIGVHWIAKGLSRRLKNYANWLRIKISKILEKYSARKKIAIMDHLSKKISGEHFSKNWTNLYAEEIEVAVWCNVNFSKNAQDISDRRECRSLDLDNPNSIMWAKCYFIIGFYAVSPSISTKNSKQEIIIKLERKTTSS